MYTFLHVWGPMVRLREGEPLKVTEVAFLQKPNWK